MKNERSCGKCYMCCWLGLIEEINKPPQTDCWNLDLKRACNFCTIYEKRPGSCSGFECSWKKGYGEETDRPDLSGIMLFLKNLNGGTYIFAVELKQHAVFEGGKNIILDMVSKVDFPVIVSNYGVKPPNDTGNRVVVKSSLLNRSRNIRSKFLNNLAPDVGVYILKNNPRRV